jgi:hypothetical protein
MKTKTYTTPGHVMVLNVLCLLSLLVGLVIVANSEFEIEPLGLGVGALIGALYLWIFATVADQVARNHHRLDQLCSDLLPVINEARINADEREKRERATQLARDEEIRRVVESRFAKGAERASE